MIGIFSGRGIADRARAHAQIDVDFRAHVHLFNNGRNLNPLGVFLCVALHANEYGWAWPSRDTLMRETGISTQEAMTAALAHLRQLRIEDQRVFAHYREIGEDGRYGRSAYLIFPDLPSACIPDQFTNLREYDPRGSLEALAQEIEEHVVEVGQENSESEALFVGLFGEGPEPTTPPARTTESALAEVAAAEGRMFARMGGSPWLAWGSGSGVMDRYGRVDIPKEAVQRIGHALGECGLKPVWENPKEAKSWVAGIQQLYRVADGNVERVLQAVKRAIEENAQRAPTDRLTLVKPHSFEFAVRDVMVRQAEAQVQQTGNQFYLVQAEA